MTELVFKSVEQKYLYPPNEITPVLSLSKGDDGCDIYKKSENGPRTILKEDDQQHDNHQVEQGRVKDIMVLFESNMCLYEERDEKVWGKGKESSPHFYLTLSISYA